jgi:hypothetical protein
VLYPGLALLDLAGPLQVISALAGGGLDYQGVVVSERIKPLRNGTHR